MAEQVFCKHLVGGSSPLAGSNRRRVPTVTGIHVAAIPERHMALRTDEPPVAPIRYPVRRVASNSGATTPSDTCVAALRGESHELPWGDVTVEIPRAGRFSSVWPERRLAKSQAMGSSPITDSGFARCPRTVVFARPIESAGRASLPQWQSACLPSRIRGFDSRNWLQQATNLSRRRCIGDRHRRRASRQSGGTAYRESGAKCTASNVRTGHPSSVGRASFNCTERKC